MKEDFVVVDTIAVQVRLEDVLRQLGYRRDGAVPPAMCTKINTEIGETRSLIEPKGAYLKLNGMPEGEFELFRGVEGIVLALATIGPKVETRAGELVNAQRASDGLIVDAIGTVAVEQTADFVERKMRQDCVSSGWKVSRRYAPGYCGWGMEAQKEIFRHFDDTLGIKLTGSCLMMPEKSLSFVCLLSSDGDFSMVKVGNCKRCKQEDCPYRSEPFQIGN